MDEILLIEDDQSLRRAVSLKLTKEGYHVYAAESIAQGWELYEKHSIMLILCDVGLPDGSGLDFCIQVRKQEERCGIVRRVVFLFLTAMDAETDMINGYEAGGDDYITKPFSLAVLISKVNAMMKRQRIDGGLPETFRSGAEQTPEFIRSGNITLWLEEKRVQKEGCYLNLTANEYKLLAYFMKHAGKILSKTQILEAVWDIDGNFIDENTLAVNIRRLREKIEEDPSSPSMIRNVRGLGYIWERECERS